LYNHYRYVLERIDEFLCVLITMFATSVFAGLVGKERERERARDNANRAIVMRDKPGRGANRDAGVSKVVKRANTSRFTPESGLSRAIPGRR